jgi:DNA-nicking Smr family endonuclease
MKLRIPRHAPARGTPAEETTPRSQADEGALFREAVGRVRPLARTPDSLPRAARPAANASQFEKDEAGVSGALLSAPFDPASIEMGDEILYLKSGASPNLLNRLRRGHYSIRSEIDLHQMSVAVARAAVKAFLDEAIRHREYCVRIIHGKGLRSATRGPVVKRMTEQLLRRRGDVVAFASALPAQGGTGAVLVLLQDP